MALLAASRLQVDEKGPGGLSRSQPSESLMGLEGKRMGVTLIRQITEAANAGLASQWDPARGRSLRRPCGGMHSWQFSPLIEARGLYCR